MPFYDFIKMYANLQNIILIAGALVAAVIVWNILACIFSFMPLKKIVRALRDETGEDIILRINAMHLHGRYKKMWDEYYFAYRNEETVALSNYLTASDMPFFFDPFRALCRGTVLIFAALCIVFTAKTTGFTYSVKNSLICAECILVILLAISEIINKLLFVVKQRKLARLTEEFSSLSLRKLPGKAVDFASRYILRKLDKNGERLNALQNSVTQVNARLDRQYKIFTDSVEEENK